MGVDLSIVDLVSVELILVGLNIVNHRNRIFWFRPNTNLRWLEITEYSAETEYSVIVYFSRIFGNFTEHSANLPNLWPIGTSMSVYIFGNFAEYSVKSPNILLQINSYRIFRSSPKLIIFTETVSAEYSAKFRPEYSARNPFRWLTTADIL